MKTCFILITKKKLIFGLITFAACLTAIIAAAVLLSDAEDKGNDPSYVIFGANDLGMHCYQKDFSGFLILPPGNTLKVQVIENGGNEAKLIKSGIEVSYSIINNSYSAGKTNFWEYAADYGYDVPPNIGITGNGLSGVFKLSADGKYYEASWVPVTPYFDGSDKLAPYQTVSITVKDKETGKVLAVADNVVVPVSDEMMCSVCHGAENTDLDILKAHDELSNTSLAADLEQGKRHKCGECHPDNALGLKGEEGVLPLSEAIHGFHSGKMEMTDITPKCYACHPGPESKCYRGRMYIAGITCDDPKCHGTMANIAQTQAGGRKAWFQEPDCAACHGPLYGANPDTLYRNSYLVNAPAEEMDNIILCASCHNSPHAIWRSSLDLDNRLPYSLQGIKSYIKKCSVCHAGEGKVHIKNR